MKNCGATSCEPRRIIFVRRELRHLLRANAMIRDARSGHIGGKVIDISENGCKLDLTESRVETGQLVTIKLDGFESWPAKIRWIKDRIVGVEFERPLHSYVVEHLCKARLAVAFE